MKPSPGPWRWVKGHWDLLGLFSRAAGEEKCVLQAGSSQDIHAYNMDDAALIALAPEMREMLLRLEWSGTDAPLDDDLPPIPSCPLCGARKGEKLHVRCTLGALMDRIR